MPEDTQSVELLKLLDEAEPAAIVEEVMGVEPGEPLHEPLVETVALAQRERLDAAL